MANATIEKKEFVMKSVPKNWTGDNLEQELFKAFERGEEYQKKKDADEFKSIVETNLHKATTLSENIFLSASKDYEVKIEKALLKIDDIHHFETIFIVDRKSYFSKQIKDVYKKSFEVKKNFNCDEFRIDFMFMPSSENINMESMNADGFVFGYGQK